MSGSSRFSGGQTFSDLQSNSVGQFILNEKSIDESSLSNPAGGVFVSVDELPILNVYVEKSPALSTITVSILPAGVALSTWMFLILTPPSINILSLVKEPERGEVIKS